jgi:hypothetical protein
LTVLAARKIMARRPGATTAVDTDLDVKAAALET